MAKRVKLNPYRLILQWTILLILAYMVIRPFVDKSYVADFEAYCPFGGIQAFSSFLANNSLACSMTTTQIFMGLALVLGVILVSKLFCSHICPIGSITEWLSRMGRRLKLNFEIKGFADRALRVLKYSLLFVTFYFTVTSSELFCRTFDPYYAVFSGFSSDVVLSYAIMALFLAIPGSFFVRQFWCRYVCPLGAISNIFSHSFVFIGITLIYFLLVLVLKVPIHWIWLLGTLTVAGLVLEIFKVQVKGFSIFRITRNADTCTSCKLCDKACSMSLSISKSESVKDVDCHLCGDCVASCPEENTLRIVRLKAVKTNEHSPKKRTLLWIPSAVTVVLIILGLGFAEKIQIPTISVMWGSNKQIEEAAIFEQSGLASIKCFGSSMSFANHMKELHGILGVETYVSDKSVRIFYDDNEISEEDIKRAMFTPIKKLYSSPISTSDSIAICETAIDQFFDPNDAMLLGIRFSQINGILSMETSFGEPVRALIYYLPDKVNIESIKNLIEEESAEWEEEGEHYSMKTDFRVASIDEVGRMSLKDYLLKMYEPINLTFNDFESYSAKELDTVVFSFPQAADPKLTDMPWYLLSHISLDRGVVSFDVIPGNTGFDLSLKFVKGRTDYQTIKRELNEEKLTVYLNDGTLDSMSNPFKFE